MKFSRDRFGLVCVDRDDDGYPNGQQYTLPITEDEAKVLKDYKTIWDDAEGDVDSDTKHNIITLIERITGDDEWKDKGLYAELCEIVG